MSDKTAVKYIVKKIIEFYANAVLMLCLSFALCSPINRQRPFWRRRAVGADLYWLGAQGQMFFASVCVSKFLRWRQFVPRKRPRLPQRDRPSVGETASAVS
jgi:hypothetical protein